MSLGEKLVLLRLQKSLTQAQVAQQIGISRARYSHYETDRSEPDLHTLKDLADYFQVSIDYLLSSANSSHLEPSELFDELGSSNSNIVFESPVIGITKTGKTIYAGENINNHNLICLSDQRYFYIRAIEDSIKLKIQKGDLILIDRQHPIKNGIIAAVYFKKEKIIKLRHIYTVNRSTLLLPTNPIYEPVHFKSDNIQILGKAVLRLGCISQQL